MEQKFTETIKKHEDYAERQRQSYEKSLQNMQHLSDEQAAKIKELAYKKAQKLEDEMKAQEDERQKERLEYESRLLKFERLVEKLQEKQGPPGTPKNAFFPPTTSPSKKPSHQINFDLSFHESSDAEFETIIDQNMTAAQVKLKNDPRVSFKKPAHDEESVDVPKTSNVSTIKFKPSPLLEELLNDQEEEVVPTSHRSNTQNCNDNLQRQHHNASAKEKKNNHFKQRGEDHETPDTNNELAGAIHKLSEVIHDIKSDRGVYRYS